MLVPFLQRHGFTRRMVYRLGRGRAEEVVRQVVPHLSRTDRIIDIGAGTCNVCQLLRERAYDVTPIDVEDLSFVDGLRARIFDGRRLPFEDDAFDTALLLAVLHHTQHSEDVLAEAARVAPRLVVMEDVCEGRLQRAATRAIDSLLNLELFGHPHTNKSDAQWRQLFSQTGLVLLSDREERWLAIRSRTYHLERGSGANASPPGQEACGATVTEESRLGSSREGRLSRLLRRARKRKLAILITAVCLAATSAVVGIAFANRAVIRDAQPAVVDSVAHAPSAPVAIVLGARVHDDGSLFPTTQDRVETAVELYKAGKVGKLLISGDHGRQGYDEVNNMRRYAASRGVLARDIFMDHAGFDTYDTMYRARDVFGVRRATVVTQRFHLSRAVYTARALGIAAVGVPADKRVYIKAALFDAREALARAKAYLEIVYLRPEPRFLGPAIDIAGDGRVTMDTTDAGETRRDSGDATGSPSNDGDSDRSPGTSKAPAVIRHTKGRR